MSRSHPSPHRAPPRPRVAARRPPIGAVAARDVRLAFVAAGALVALLGGCNDEPGEELVERSAAHMEAAIELLEENEGEPMKLVEGVLTYRQAHRMDLIAIQQEGEALRQSLSPGARRELGERSMRRLRPLMHDIEQLAARYPDPRFVLRVIRPLTVPAGTRAPPPGSKPAWMPEPPPLPPGLPGAATPGDNVPRGNAHGHTHGHHRDHNHRHDPHGSRAP